MGKLGFHTDIEPWHVLFIQTGEALEMLGTTQGKLWMALGLLEYAKIILFTSANIHKTNGFDLLVVTGFMKMCYIPVHFPCELILTVNKHHRLVVYIFLKICDQNVLLFSSYKSLRDSYSTSAMHSHSWSIPHINKITFL